MPEIKNMFLNGKMNKDLDERLIPKGEYRDALNIDVSYSEGANVGVMQNILGNIELGSMNLVGGKCVGAVKDSEHDKIYWLVAGTNRNGIFEYDGANVKAILLEEVGDNILQFDKTRYITGINILDKILYFTDNYSEPKQVDTEYWGDLSRFGGITDFENDTINAFNLSEDRITVAKKAPLNAPTFHTLASSTRGGVGTLGNLTEIKTIDVPNFSTTNVGTADLTIEFDIVPNYEVDDIIILEYNVTVGDSTKSSSVRVKLTTETTSKKFKFTLLAKTDNVENAVDLAYTPLLEEEDPIFELKFPRFSYRYKYTNGQYSTFAPFSLPAFIPGDFEYDAKKAYNLGMQNTLRSLKLEGWITSPSATNYEADIEEIEILYKDSVSANIYVVDTIKKISNAFASPFEIKDEQIFKTIQANQLLRGYDSVPRKALAQEIVANRLIYGNFTENFNYTDKPNFTVETTPRTDSTEIVQKLGLKTARTYQVGLTFQDAYGRQTPVFSDSSGVLKLNQDNSDFNLQFKVETQTTPPTGAAYYKYYIKETSNEYYNVCISNIYDDEKGFLYVSIPSAETNKIQIDDILILKKKTGNVVYKGAERKFKVVDKLNNPPDFLANIKKTTYSASVFLFDETFAEDQTLFKKQPGKTPVQGYNTIQIQDAGAPGEANVDTRITNNFKAEMTVGAEVRFRRAGTGEKTNVYTIKSVQYSAEADPGNGGGEFTFEEAFGEDVEILYGTNLFNTAISRNEIYMEKVSTTDDSGNPEYEGKFFIKLNNSAELKEALITAFDESLLNTVSTAQIAYRDRSSNRAYNLYKVSYSQSGLSSGALNSVSYSSGYHLILQTSEFFDDAESFYNSDPLTQGFIKGNYVRISGGDQAVDSGIEVSATDALYENTTTSVGSTTNSKNVTVASAAGIEIGDYVTGAGGFTQTAFVKVTAISGNIITLSQAQSISSGASLRFRKSIDSHPNYKIEEAALIPGVGTAGYWLLKFDRPFFADSTGSDPTSLPYAGTDGASPQAPDASYCFNLETRSFDASQSRESENPAIFEVESKEGPLEIYYETEKTFPVSDLESPYVARTIPWSNCISFGNGVESDRIRDDYNAPTIGKGVRVSTVFEDNYQEDNLKSRLIFSGIYNSKNGVNRLNEFIIAEPITKDLNPEYGSIQKLHARDTDLIALCEDRVVKILANKDALYNADGNPQLTATNRVLGQAVIPATFGAYGISKNPESFVDFTYRAYFTDKNRGKVLRLSMDGLTEISEYGMKDYFKDNLAAETGLILGTYDTNKGLYNLTFENQEDTVSFSEGVKGWTSRKSFIPEAGVSLNNIYYTFKNGKLYSHTNPNRNTFYGGSITPSEVTLILNDSPSNMKNFRTLNYQGSFDWRVKISSDTNIAGASSYFGIQTDKQDGSVPYASFINKEDIYYNYLSGVTETDAASIDFKALNVQGIGELNSTSIESGTRSFVFDFELPQGITVNDDLYYVVGTLKVKLGTITEADKENKTLKIDSYDTNINPPSAGYYMFYVKDARFHTSGLLGYYAQITMTHKDNTPEEIFSVGSEISLSS